MSMEINQSRRDDKSTDVNDHLIVIDLRRIT
jgi:hypothetical protein